MPHSVVNSRTPSFLRQDAASRRRRCRRSDRRMEAVATYHVDARRRRDLRGFAVATECVVSPSTKSTWALPDKLGLGSNAFDSEGVGTSSNGPLRNIVSTVNGWYGSCTTDGRMRYIHVRRFTPLGAVNADPLTCSAYSPKGHCCGEFWPTGSAPARASVANSLPNPD